MKSIKRLEQRIRTLEKVNRGLKQKVKEKDKQLYTKKNKKLLKKKLFTTKTDLHTIIATSKNKLVNFLIKHNDDLINATSSRRDVLNYHLELKQHKSLLSFNVNENELTDRQRKFLNNLKNRVKNKTERHILTILSKNGFKGYINKTVKDLKYRTYSTLSIKTLGYDIGGKLMNPKEDGSPNYDFYQKIPTHQKVFINQKPTILNNTDIVREGLLEFYTLNGTIINILDQLINFNNIQQLERNWWEVRNEGFFAESSDDGEETLTVMENIQSKTKSLIPLYLSIVEKDLVKYNYKKVINVFFELIGSMENTLSWYNKFLNFYRLHYKKLSQNIDNILTNKEIEQKREEYIKLRK